MEEKKADDSSGEVLNPWAYFLTDYKQQLLGFPFHEDYNSFGSHGLPYTERSGRSGSDEADTIIIEVKNV